MSSKIFARIGGSWFPRYFVSYLFANLFFLWLCGGPAARSQTSSDRVVPRLITSPIDVTSRTAISGTTHPRAQRELDRGPVDPTLVMERMILVLGVSAEQEHQLRTLLDSQLRWPLWFNVAKGNICVRSFAVFRVQKKIPTSMS
jgi:hypothetical protein